jgi:hypothetical protein
MLTDFFFSSKCTLLSSSRQSGFLKILLLFFFSSFICSYFLSVSMFLIFSPPAFLCYSCWSICVSVSLFLCFSDDLLIYLFLYSCFSLFLYFCFFVHLFVCFSVMIFLSIFSTFPSLSILFFFHKFKVDLTAFFYGFLLVGWHEKQ